ncbi:alkaline phosphatase family protein [Paenibacillus campi]|uniref:alkaline phosphatase family protein n=1 Tax=Paenibacillus campi TaxID=3106031 RepID=UPI002AFDEB2B|nr:alkaline phosphatase family protein [Paenibacillus sp. SGZ-1014]
MAYSKVLVIGLDCLAPQLAFDQYIDDMPNLKRLKENGLWGELESTDPPITIPAWMVMSTSKDPGTLGAYGFRHRKDASYDKGWIANGLSFQETTVWDYMAEHDKKVCLIGLPPSYPVKSVNGWRVGCFLTPNTQSKFTYPEQLAQEILEVAPDYLFDINFRTDSRDALLEQLYVMTRERFKVLRHMLQTKPWELFWFVEIGTDRIHHAFWKYIDPEHPFYEQGNRYEHVIREYYQYIDQEIGTLLELITDDTAVMVVSDHGAKGMKGAFCINQWLCNQGYLVLNEQPQQGTSIEKCDVDWTKTVAWAWGGYYARIFINVEGREAQGSVKADEYESVITKLTEHIQGITDHKGRQMNNKVFRPQDLYRESSGDPPDLMVYFDDLSWRSAGTLGWDDLYLFENDLGPDDAVHAKEGCFVLYRPDTPINNQKLEGKTIYDIAPTLLDLFEIEPAHNMEGISIVQK